MTIHNIELHAPEAHDALGNISKVRGLCNVLHTLVKRLKREAPKLAQKAKAQRGRAYVSSAVVLRLVEAMEVRH